MSEGWIKLHRCLFKKPIWKLSTAEQKAVLITLLGMANHKQKEWEWNGHKFKCEPGQFITSIESICEACGKGISKQNVRTALARFEKFEFLTNQSTKYGRLITIINWGIYQGDTEIPNIVANKDLTKGSQSTNKGLTPNKNDKNDKNDKKVYIVGEETLTFSEVCKGIVEYLNIKAGTKYKPSIQKTRDSIQARLNDGFTVDDFKVVIDNKVNEWKNDKVMCKYLRPETLFSNKFEGYLNQKQATTQVDELMRIAREGL